MHENGNTMPADVCWSLSINRARFCAVIHPLPAGCYELSAIQLVNSNPQGLLPPLCRS